MVARLGNLLGSLAILAFGNLTGVHAQSAPNGWEVPVVLRLLDQAEAPARSAGVVVEVLVREGDHVEQGEVLARLEDVEARLSVDAAQIDAEIARQQAQNDVPLRYAAKVAEVARAELRRSSESIRQFAKSVSQSQIDVERLTADKAELEKEKATQDHQAAKLELGLRKNRLAAASAALEQRKIVAPQGGVVVEISVHAGEWLEPGQKAFRLVQISRLRAEAFVDAQKADASLEGRRVEVAGLSGSITFVSPEVDPINQQVRLVAEIDNPDQKLRPGDRAMMTIERTTLQERAP